MTNPPARRPLPALVFLLALCLLAALVWWRVLNRHDGNAAAAPTCTTTSTPGKTLPEPAAITVTVVNSTTRQGIAGAARQVLVADGFRIPGKAVNDAPAFGGNGHAVPGVAEIRYGTAGAQGGELLAYYFPGAKLVHLTRTDALVVVSLGTAYRAVRKQSDVAAALQANGIRLVPTTGAPVTTPSPTGC
jgi:hypothetical protein